MRTGCLPYHLIQYSTFEILDREIRQEKDMKELEIGKKEVKLSLFADDMIVYLEDPNTPPEDF
jgi:hypothetical protein